MLLIVGKIFCFYFLSNFHYTRRVMPKRETSGRPHLRGLKPRQHSSEETVQQGRAVGDTVPDLTVSPIKPQTSHTVNDVRA